MSFVQLGHTDLVSFFSLFFFNDTATTEIYTLSLHDALPISNALGSPFISRSTEHEPSMPPAGQPRLSLNTMTSMAGIFPGWLEATCSQPHRSYTVRASASGLTVKVAHGSGRPSNSSSISRRPTPAPRRSGSTAHSITANLSAALTSPGGVRFVRCHHSPAGIG